MEKKKDWSESTKKALRESAIVDCIITIAFLSFVCGFLAFMLPVLFLLDIENTLLVTGSLFLIFVIIVNLVTIERKIKEVINWMKK